MIILGIDPGPKESAFCVLRDGWPSERGILPNQELELICQCDDWGLIAIEWMQSYGQIIGRDVFETCLTVGRFTFASDAITECIDRWKLYPRTKIKAYITGISKAKDADVRRALINRFGGDRKGEPLGRNEEFCKVSSHMWAALAVAVYAHDGAKLGEW